MKVIIDQRNNLKNLDKFYDITDATKAAEIASSMDGAIHTLISFERDDGVNLMIGGGPENFVITRTERGDNLTLVSSIYDNDDLIEICAGGQFGEFPSNIVCKTDQVQRIVRRFYNNDEMICDWV